MLLRLLADLASALELWKMFSLFLPESFSPAKQLMDKCKSQRSKGTHHLKASRLLSKDLLLKGISAAFPALLGASDGVHERVWSLG